MNDPNVAIVTPFRNSGAGIDAYIDRALALEWPDPIHNLRWHLVEGDSEDDTWAQLEAWAGADSRVWLHKCDTGGLHYGSQVHPERFRILAKVFNTGINGAVADDWADYVCFIPSDVFYQGDLLKRLHAWDKDIISPMFWVKGGGDSGYRFYDVWGFIQNGKTWPPANYEWYKANMGNEPIEMTTVGGVKLIKREVLETGARYTPEEVDHGLCKLAQAEGFSCWADPTTHIVHGPERFPI